MMRRQPGGSPVLRQPIESAQYTSWIFGHRLREAGLLGSIGRVASSVDNTMMESIVLVDHATRTPRPLNLGVQAPREHRQHPADRVRKNSHTRRYRGGMIKQQ